MEDLNDKILNELKEKAIERSDDVEVSDNVINEELGGVDGIIWSMRDLTRIGTSCARHSIDYSFQCQTNAWPMNVKQAISTSIEDLDISGDIELPKQTLENMSLVLQLSKNI